MRPIERIGVIAEFEQYLRGRHELEKEVLFKRIMPTDRRFRADYLIDGNIIVEVNGGQFIGGGGRHTRGGPGYERDLFKINLAQANGFRVYQFTYEMLLRREYKQIL